MIPFTIIGTLFAIVIIASSYMVDISSMVIGVSEISNVILEPNSADQSAPLTAQVPRNIPLIVSAIAVFFFYYARFSIWPESADPRLKTRPTRFYTTSYKYFLGATLYSALMVTFFVLSVRFPEYFLAAFAKLFGVSEVTPTESRSPPELVAYFLAFYLVVWPKITPVDDAIRKVLQTNFGIPLQAHGLVKQLLTDIRVKFSASPEIVNQILASQEKTLLLRRKDFDLTEKVGTEFRPTVARIGYLLAELESKEGKKGYVRALQLQQAEYQDTITRYDDLVELANAADVSSDSKLEKKRLDDANQLLERVYDIVVFSVFLAKVSFESRPSVLLEFGFQIPRAPRLLNPDVLTWIALLLFLGTLLPLGVFMVFTVISETTPPPESILAMFIPKDWGETAIWSLFSTLMHLFATVVGIAVIRSLIIDKLCNTLSFSPGSAGRTPTTPLSLFDQSSGAPRLFHYLVAFLAAFSLSVFLIAFADLIDPNPMIIQINWPWAIVPGVTGSFVAYNLMFLIGQEKGRRLDRKVMQRKVLLQASVTSITALFVASVVVLDRGQLLPKPTAFPFLVYVILGAFLVGGLVAYGVLLWYDKRRVEHLAEENVFLPSEKG